MHASAGQREQGFKPKGEQSGHGGAGGGLHHGEPPSEDPELSHPRCVFQLLKGTTSATRPSSSRRRAAARWRIFRRCRGARTKLGPRADERVRLRGGLDAAHGRRAIHPLGGDHPAAPRQHRPAGRRGDGAAGPRLDPGVDRIPTLYNILPGYLPMPHTEGYGDLETFIQANTSPTGCWATSRRTG